MWCESFRSLFSILKKDKQTDTTENSGHSLASFMLHEPMYVCELLPLLFPLIKFVRTARHICVFVMWINLHSNRTEKKNVDRFWTQTIFLARKKYQFTQKRKFPLLFQFSFLCCGFRVLFCIYLQLFLQ